MLLFSFTIVSIHWAFLTCAVIIKNNIVSAAKDVFNVHIQQINFSFKRAHEVSFIIMLGMKLIFSNFSIITLTMY
jgi:hypothetical protein